MKRLFGWLSSKHSVLRIGGQMRSRLKRAFLAVLLLLTAGAVCAADWSEWRGRGRDGICAEKNLLQKWPDGGPQLLWKAQGLGEGYSGPAIVDQTIYTMGKAKNTEFVLALDIKRQGAVLWKTPICKSKYKQAFKGTRPMPTVDGDRVYALETMGTLVCVDAKPGKLIWKKHFVDDFGGIVPRWGYAESVLIDGDKVVCMPGGDSATVVAMNKLTGEPLWKSGVGDKASYSSMLKVVHEGVEQYVGFTFEAVVGVRASDGELLWRYKEPAHHADWGHVNVMVPIWSGGRVFASSGYGHGGGMARIKKTEQGFRAEQVWYSKEIANQHGGVVLLDGKLYGTSDPRDLKCMDFDTGKVLWETKEVGKGSVLYADGMLYCRAERGPVSLVKATPDGFVMTGRFEQPDRSKKPSWVHPVIADGKLYLRDQDLLLCYNVRDGDSESARR